MVSVAEEFLQVMEGLCMWEKHETILEPWGLERGCVGRRWVRGIQRWPPMELSDSLPDSLGRMGVLMCSQGAPTPTEASLGHSKQIG